MSFAAFILKLEADTKGVNAGVNTAIGHFKRLSKTVSEINKRKDESVKKDREAAKAAFDRLRPEEQLNALMRTREQIANRLARAENPSAKNAYLQKQLELESRITAAMAARWGASAPPILAPPVLSGGGTVVAGAAAATGLEKKGHKHLENSAGSFIKSLLSLAGFSKALGTGADAMIGDPVAFSKGGAKAGLSREDSQRLGLAAREMGLDPETLFGMMADLRKSGLSAIAGDADKRVAFGKLGVNANSSPLEMLGGISKGGPLTGDRLKAFTDVAGNAASDVLPALNRGLLETANSFSAVSISSESSVGGMERFVRGLTVAASRSKALIGWEARLGGRLAKNIVGGQLRTLDAPTVSDMETRLADAEANRAARDKFATQDKADVAAAEARRNFDAHQKWLEAQKKDKRKESFSKVDTDELARIGLFRGGQGGQQKFQDDILREVRKMQRDIEQIRSDGED